MKISKSKKTAPAKTAGAVPQNKRTTGKEQYYTPQNIALQCTKKMLKFVSNKNSMFWLEPAGGTGQFVEAMLANGIKPDRIVSYDIEPHHRLVKKTKDFLKVNLQDLKGESDCFDEGERTCVTLTNPPFGRANSLCVPFFNHCATVSKYIGFLIPKSWRKWSVQNKLHDNFHLIHDEEIEADFIYPASVDAKKASKGKLATVFQIWEYRDEKRPKLTVEDRGYITKTTPEEADVSLTVFGRGCGTVKKDFERVPNTTQMFLKVNKKWVYKALQTVDFSQFFNNVAFIEALSFAEINHLLNEYKDKLS